MTELNDEVKTFIVQALACFDPPSVVAAAVKEEFDGLVVSRQAVHVYDPTKRAGRDLSEKLKALFEETRKAFLEEKVVIGIAHRIARIRRYDRIADRAEAMGNLQLAAEMCERAAKEMGGAFTNKREHSGPNGGPIPVEKTVIVLPSNDRDKAAARTADGVPEQ